MKNERDNERKKGRMENRRRTEIQIKQKKNKGNEETMQHTYNDIRNERHNIKTAWKTENTA